MANELQIPSSFENRGMAKAFQGKVSLDDNLADGIAQGFPIIAYKGKIWALRYRGDRKIVSRKDDGTPSAHLDVIILKQAKNKSRTYYAGTYVDGSEDRPACASLDGITPDADVQDRQAEVCALCPRSVWKNDPKTGRRGRECTEYKRLAVLVMPNQTEPLFGKAILDPMFLRVPPDSLQSLAVMGDTMTHKGFAYQTYLTRITFDPLKAHPSMVFRPVRPLDDPEGQFVLEVCEREEIAINRIVGLEPATSGPKLVTAPVTSTLPGTAQTLPGTQQATLPWQDDEDDEEEVEEATLVPPAPAPKPAPASAAQAEAPKKRGRPPKVAAVPVQQAVANLVNGNGASNDAGEGTPTDDELDDEIAKLIRK